MEIKFVLNAPSPRSLRNVPCLIDALPPPHTRITLKCKKMLHRGKWNNLVSFLLALLTVDYKVHQSHVQSSDNTLLSRCFTIKEANDSNMIEPDDDEDIDIKLSTTSLGFKQALLAILLP